MSTTYNINTTMIYAQQADTEADVLEKFRAFKAKFMETNTLESPNIGMFEECENVLEAATSLEKTLSLYGGMDLGRTSSTLNIISSLLQPAGMLASSAGNLNTGLAEFAKHLVTAPEKGSAEFAFYDQSKAFDLKERVFGPLIYAITEDNADDLKAELKKNRAKSNSMIADVVLIRLLRSMTDKVFNMKETELMNLLVHGNDDEVLMDTFTHTLLESDSMSAKMKTQLLGIQAKKEWLEQRGGSIGLNEAAEMLNVSRETLNKYRKELKVLTVQTGSRWKYPVWQFEGGKVVPGLAEVLKNLNESGKDSWSMLRFLINENTYLENNFPENSSVPIDVLREGHLDRVLQAAELYMTHSAA